MENPERDIEGVIKSLTEGTRKEQRNAVNEYFLPDAFFVHPFCRVPSFSYKRYIPYINVQLKITSRLFILLIYQWYKILSPKIKLEVLSTSFDKKQNLLYANIRQTFTIWIVPFSLWQANVQLVCLLNLECLEVDGNKQPLVNQGAMNGVPAKRYFIRGQQDHYQVNEFLKFILPWGGSVVWYLWQLFATLLSAAGVALFWPVTSFYESSPALQRNHRQGTLKNGNGAHAREN